MVAGLFYLTLASAPEGPPSGASHSAAGAADACQLAVSDTFAAVSFPFSANAEYLQDGEYHLTGVIDIDQGRTVQRANYECWMTWSAGEYGTDSLRIWQSH